MSSKASPSHMQKSYLEDEHVSLPPYPNYAEEMIKWEEERALLMREEMTRWEEERTLLMREEMIRWDKERAQLMQMYDSNNALIALLEEDDQKKSKRSITCQTRSRISKPSNLNTESTQTSSSTTQSLNGQRPLLPLAQTTRSSSSDLPCSLSRLRHLRAPLQQKGYLEDEHISLPPSPNYAEEMIKWEEEQALLLHEEMITWDKERELLVQLYLSNNALIALFLEEDSQKKSKGQRRSRKKKRKAPSDLNTKSTQKARNGFEWSCSPKRKCCSSCKQDNE